MQAQNFTHYRTCNLCEAMCGLEIEVENNQVKTIKGDKNDPFSRGHICPKAVALKDLYEDPDRLKRPIKRTESGWEEISWEQAFEEVVSNLKRIHHKYGKDAIGIYQGNPNVHNSGSLLFSGNFLRYIKTKNRFSATSVDQLPHQFVAYNMFGHQSMIPIPDIDRTAYMLLFGANPLASNGSLMTCPDFANRLKAIQKRGGKFITIDPRLSETGKIADEHIFVKPGRDVLFLLAMVHVLFQENLVNMGHLVDFSEGIEDLQVVSQNYSPEYVSNYVGVETATIRRVAREFAQAEKAVCYGRMGVSTQEFGSLCHWLINSINILTGNLDAEGGAMFTLPAFDLVGITGTMGARGSRGRWHSRVRELPEIGGELSCSVMAEEILTEGEGQIKAMITAAGNPILSTPNGGQLDKAFESLEYMVAIDIYLNETTRHANIILPPTTGLEVEHYDVAFHYLAIRNTAKYSERLFEPEEGTMEDWQIYRELGKVWTGGEMDEKAQKDPTRRLSHEGLLDLALRFGPYGSKGLNLLGKENAITLQKLRENPHGIDLGALKPLLPQRLFTKDKKIKLNPDIFLEDLKRLDTTLSESQAQNGELLLIGRRHLRSNNSWMHNSQRLVKGRNRCTLLMNPNDAQKRSFENGQIVEVQSRVGKINIELEVSDEIMQGVVSIPHGWGHNKKGIKLQVAEAHAGVSVNDLTDELFLDQLSGNVALSGVPVEVSVVKEEVVLV